VDGDLLENQRIPLLPPDDQKRIGNLYRKVDEYASKKIAEMQNARFRYLATLRDNGIDMEKATFGAGCFWGVEAAFRQVKGVVSTAVGYSGGHFPNPTYKDVCSGKTGHAEVVQVEYEPTQVSYDDLLKVFWDNHDPTTLNRQGPDVGAQYRSAIFFHTPEQESAAKASKEKVQAGYKNKIVTEITPASEFYRAEDYHQQYLEKRGLAHCSIR
jgi:peptide-methionine (S)-S-oxide reductase